jgi:cytochrome d ubiquinol oxidase subunit II
MMSSLVPFWFIVIAILWTGFFVLEGFDFGVGMLHSVLGRDEAGRLARAIAPVTGAAVTGFVIWTHVGHSSTFFLNPVELLAILAVLAAVRLVYEHRDGFAFTATTVTMASCIVAIFVGLYPNVMVSSTNAAYNLTVHNTASGAYALKAMTVVVVVFLPFVLVYQAWSYYVFRRRISAQEFAPGSSVAGEAD